MAGYDNTNVQVINTTFQAANAIGLVPDYSATIETAASGATGNTFPNSGREFVAIKNNYSNDMTVTFNDQSVCDHDFDHDVVAVIATGVTKMFGPFPVAWFTKTCQMTYTLGTGGTAPTMAVFQLPALSPGPGRG
jgi:hypothetical protein